MEIASAITERRKESSERLSLSLAGKLQERTKILGSTLFDLNWKVRVTPSGRSVPSLVASARRISDNDCTSWPTPSANNYEQADQEALYKRRQECKERTGNGNGFLFFDYQPEALWDAITRAMRRIWRVGIRQQRGTFGARAQQRNSTRYGGRTIEASR